MAYITALAATADEVESARAVSYRLISRLLAAPADAPLLEMIGQLDGDPSEFGKALSALGDVGRRSNITALRREYQRLFIGVGRGELVPFASFYITGFLHEKPLAVLRDDLLALGIARQDDVPEPEDHIAALCEVMAGLISGELGLACKDAGLVAEKQFFERHIAPWAERFANDLEASPNAVFYARVGTLLKTLITIERTAFHFVATGDKLSERSRPHVIG